MRTKRALTISAFAAICFGLALLLESSPPYAYVRLRNLYRDAISQAGRTTAPNSDLVFLALDSNSISLDETDFKQLYNLSGDHSEEARALRLMSKSWPWSREVYALMLDRLMQAGARVVAFDLTFPTVSENDAPLRLALDKYKDRVVVGSNFVDGTLTRPPDTLVPQTAPIDDRVAFTNFWPNEDNVVRQAQYRVTFEQARDTAPQIASERFLSLAARVLVKAGLGKTIPPGLAPQTFRFTAPPRHGFPPRSIFEIFVPDYWEHNYRSGEFFRNKIVVIGAEGNWQHDEHPTPLGLMPGAELHLNAINAAIHGEFIREMPARSVTLLAAVAGLLAISLSFFIRSPGLRLLALVVCDLIAARIALTAFDHLSLYLPMAPAFFELNLTVLLGLAGDFTWERMEKKHLRKTLERYVSQNVVREMLDNPGLFAQSLGGETRAATILFSDIRDFSSVAARTPPQALVRQLNEYLTAMVECVFRFGGTLDKFAGDAVMAVWGNLRSDGPRQDAANAVRSALAMRDELKRLNESWRQRGLSELRIGIAVNHGDVVVGNIGSPHRMEFTVIGHAVNLSWKLQELTKRLDASLVVSEKVHSLVIEYFEMNSCGCIEVPSLKSSVELYSVTGPVNLEAAEPAPVA